jgi:hypothetical protein
MWFHSRCWISSGWGFSFTWGPSWKRGVAPEDRSGGLWRHRRQRSPRYCFRLRTSSFSSTLDPLCSTLCSILNLLAALGTDLDTEVRSDQGADDTSHSGEHGRNHSRLDAKARQHPHSN